MKRQLHIPPLQQRDTWFPVGQSLKDRHIKALFSLSDAVGPQAF